MHPLPPSSIHLQTKISQPPSTSPHHPSQYANPTITRNWTIFPNLGRNIQSCPFWVKIGLHGILEVLIPNLDLDFWNSNPNIHFWANLDPKRQSCLFCFKIGTHGISGILILIPALVFWNSDPKIHFWANLDQKS